MATAFERSLRRGGSAIRKPGGDPRPPPTVFRLHGRTSAPPEDDEDLSAVFDDVPNDVSSDVTSTSDVTSASDKESTVMSLGVA